MVTAASAADALPLIERERPDVLVSDIGMPGIDGDERLHRVRALGGEWAASCRRLRLPLFARAEDRTRALRPGFLVHVAKPVGAAELIAAIARRG